MRMVGLDRASMAQESSNALGCCVGHEERRLCAQIRAKASEFTAKCDSERSGVELRLDGESRLR